MSKVRIIRLLEYIGEAEDLKKTMVQSAIPLNGERDFGLTYIRSALLGSFPEQINPAEYSPYDLRPRGFTQLQRHALEMAIAAVAELGPSGLGAQLILQQMFGHELEAIDCRHVWSDLFYGDTVTGKECIYCKARVNT